MKHGYILTAVLLILLLSFCAFACASAAEIRPIPVDHDTVDLSNGEFRLSVRSTGRITGSGFFLAVLYQQDHYDAEQIKGLAAGDTVYMNDLPWTVSEVVIHTDDGDETLAVYEIYPVEDFDGYLVFQPCEDGTFVAVIDDCAAVTLLGTVKVSLPLPDRFGYVRIAAGEEQDPLGADELIEALKQEDAAETFTAWNTSCVFENGELVRVVHSDYPEGLDESFAGWPVPVWKFCHGLRDGLDTAVITASKTDCEAGPEPVELTPEEAESIRRMAICGMVTKKASDESITSNTWVYSFVTPAGKHLLSVEMYRGLIVSSDGMYSFQ